MTTDIESVPSRDEDVEDLVWSMLDENITAEDFQRLEGLLGADEDARRLYLECVQLHVDLQQWFNPKAELAQRVAVVPPFDLSLPSGDTSLANYRQCRFHGHSCPFRLERNEFRSTKRRKSHSAAKVFLNTPIPSISTSVTSPAFR